METGKVNLREHFGRETIKKHDVFASAPVATEFLRAYAFNENKSIVQIGHSGHKNVWGCKSEAFCAWEVSLSKKRPTKRANTKLVFCPKGAWFVSSAELVHSPSCDSVGEASADILAKLPGFRSALVKGLSSARARVASALKVVDNVNVDDRPALLYRAIAKSKKMMAGDDGSYAKLPAFLRSFERLNPGSRVCCQLDSKGRFFRLFLSFGALVAAQDNCVPLLECDGTHMKNEQYNGVCLLVIGKDGNWANIPLVIAFVHKETAENFEWFFANCIAAGIKLHDRATFTERGKQRDAQVRLDRIGIHLNLKFCAWHIYFNVCSHFRAVEPNIDNIKGLIFRLQATTTLDEYNKALAVIDKQFPAVRIRSVNGQKQTQSAAEYLRALHPGSWTKFGNCALNPEEISAVETQWKQTRSYGAPCALFAGRTTSAVEGQNNALLLGGVRDSQVLEALVLFCNLAVETLNDKEKESQEVVSRKAHRHARCKGYV